MIQITEIKRKNQRGYRNGDGTDPERVIAGTRGYKSEAARNAAIKCFVRHGCQYMTKYRDTASQFALYYSYEQVAWLKPGQVHIG